METDLPSRSVEATTISATRNRRGAGIVTRGVAMITHRRSLRVLAFTIGAVATAAAGTGLGQWAGNAAAAAAASPENVVIHDFSFGPATLTVAPGTQVIWTNRDGEPHRVVNAAEPKLFQSAALDTGDTYSFKFDQAGVYRYFCSIHPRMTGTVVVK